MSAESGTGSTHFGAAQGSAFTDVKLDQGKGLIMCAPIQKHREAQVMPGHHMPPTISMDERTATTSLFPLNDPPIPPSSLSKKEEEDVERFMETCKKSIETCKLITRSIMRFGHDEGIRLAHLHTDLLQEHFVDKIEKYAEAHMLNADEFHKLAMAHSEGCGSHIEPLGLERYLLLQQAYEENIKALELFQEAARFANLPKQEQLFALAHKTKANAEIAYAWREWGRDRMLLFMPSNPAPLPDLEEPPPRLPPPQPPSAQPPPLPSSSSSSSSPSAPPLSSSPSSPSSTPTSPLASPFSPTAYSGSPSLNGSLSSLPSFSPSTPTSPVDVALDEPPPPFSPPPPLPSSSSSSSSLSSTPTSPFASPFSSTPPPPDLDLEEEKRLELEKRIDTLVREEGDSTGAHHAENKRLCAQLGISPEELEKRLDALRRG